MKPCPNLNCDAVWTIEEIEADRCAACGYPDEEDPDAIDDDDDSLDPNDSRNL